jgi:triosephosphate isomerase (TIM)
MSALVIANWKMNGALSAIETFAEAWASVVVPDDVHIVICPPYVYLSAVREAMPRGVQLGAQDCAGHKAGAFTGDVAADMLVESGCDWVIVGHSERRQYHAETDEQVAQKARLAQEAGLCAVVCVGEQLAQREAGEHKQVVSGQLVGSLDGVGLENLVVAYEPVWAIGTGHSASPQQAEDMHRWIKDCLMTRYGANAQQIPVIYGGSVKPETAAELFACETIDGALVGGASLEAISFAEIAQAGASGRN